MSTSTGLPLLPSHRQTQRSGISRTGTNGRGISAGHVSSISTERAEAIARNDGSWLCDTGVLQRYIQRLCQAEPSLRRQDSSSAAIAPLHARKTKTCLIESYGDGFQETVGLGDVDSTLWSEHFQQRRQEIKIERVTNGDDSPDEQGTPIRSRKRKRIYLAEGVTPALVKLFGEFFCELGLDPMFFAQHVERGTKIVFDEHIEVPTLPSAHDLCDYACIRYYDLYKYSGKEVQFGEVEDGRHKSTEHKKLLTANCADTARPVIYHRWQEREDETVLITPRKCSFWIHRYKDGGYDALILCDPALKRIARGSPIDLNNMSNFLGGYADFVPRPDGYNKFLQHEASQTGDARSISPSDNDSQHQPSQGISTTTEPARECLFDDLVYYYTKHGHHLSDDDPFLFVKKICASKYIQLISLISNQFDAIRTADWKDATSSPKTKSWFDLKPAKPTIAINTRSLENAWYRFRVQEYLGDIETTILSLGIRWNDPSCTRTQDWRDCRKDFQFAAQRLNALKDYYDRSTNHIIGRAGMQGNRQAIEEAKLAREEQGTLKLLTYVATVFVPLASIASIFSIGDPYKPGSKEFYVYCAVAFPCLFIVLATVLVLEKGPVVRDFISSKLGWLYIDDGASTQSRPIPI
ncbi:hypothetical protein P152DRAFT_483513 [Eremomyces bilateralis CBS 781.70]|uniref:Cora-domain-containing protein n=1 Tax=Eremomyces bilateralis CBS 781.70 TaxID=1392243 RepID=A0A6G1FYN8_9PEZI|nr:uncharacterized protein P152DRAFT_483513 [Eremomyces bilateralis CBS 781.70]KAF1810786.1 hypothetical protein P152DRAFT_483513 [Eremomyces bilateralis CBS 781.70]